jgi:hypothetical protein
MNVLSNFENNYLALRLWRESLAFVPRHKTIIGIAAKTKKIPAAKEVDVMAI